MWNCWRIKTEIWAWDRASFHFLLILICIQYVKNLFEKFWWPWKGPFCMFVGCCLTSESVEGSALSLEGVDNIHGCYGLPLGVLSVGDSISDDVFQENFQDTTGLFVDESGDTFDTTSSCKTTDGWLGDTLDIITQHLPVTLGASFSESFTSFSSAWHVSDLLFSKSNEDEWQSQCLYTTNDNVIESRA